MQPAPTTQDLLQQAAAATPAERPALVGRAEAIAVQPDDQLAVAEAWAETGDRDAAERCLGVALRASEYAVWPHRRAALTRWRLGDHAAAVATLVKLEQELTARRATDGLDWRLLAEGFDELCDADGASRCLQAGSDSATTAIDLCQVARGCKELRGDLDAARRLIERAEGLAAVAAAGGQDLHSARWVAIACSELLGDQAGARRMLDAVLAGAVDVSGCLLTAAAWSGHGRPPGEGAADVRRCFAKARGFAASFDDWFNLAEAIHDFDRDAKGARSALRSAQELAATPAQRRQLSRALRDWFGDYEAAEALGPMGLAPAELAPGGMSPLGWPRDAAALWDWLRSRVTVPTLESIAAADFHPDKHLAVLLDMWRTGCVPVPLPWYPREAVSLCQWSEGLDVDHVQRAFCCTVLCLEALSPEAGGPGCIEDTLTVLVESCLLLGAEASERLPGLLVALVDCEGREQWDQARGTLALFLVAAHRDPLDPRLEGVAARLLAIDAAIASSRYPKTEHSFVFGEAFEGVRLGTWQRLVRTTVAGMQADPARLALAQVIGRLGTT